MQDTAAGGVAQPCRLRNLSWVKVKQKSRRVTEVQHGVLFAQGSFLPKKNVVLHDCNIFYSIGSFAPPVELISHTVIMPKRSLDAKAVKKRLQKIQTDLPFNKAPKNRRPKTMKQKQQAWLLSGLRYLRAPLASCLITAQSDCAGICSRNIGVAHTHTHIYIYILYIYI